MFFLPMAGLYVYVCVSGSKKKKIIKKILSVDRAHSHTWAPFSAALPNTRDVPSTERHHGKSKLSIGL